jgi:hypothetical protein
MILLGLRPCWPYFPEGHGGSRGYGARRRLQGDRAIPPGSRTPGTAVEAHSGAAKSSYRNTS